MCMELQLLKSWEQGQALLSEDRLLLFYFTQPNCSVCHGFKPQLENLLPQYPEWNAWHVDASQIPEMAGQMQVFTAPAVLAFYQGKELFRFARFIPVGQLEERLEQMKNIGM
ncbi:thioredoxin family protein [Rubeoparvulum massiliense]|uniref:thioredoxin family protein n=1 Tax=Rubeoparvulum massiliense TaxID=1631346 RepID=UPI001E616D8D|nr:thioredoxin family protein [Rubeoparvulum massiliense]